MTFDIGDELVRKQLGSHEWDDELCPHLLIYDPSKNADWYEQLQPDKAKSGEAGE
jgi:hypothetical protein